MTDIDNQQDSATSKEENLFIPQMQVFQKNENYEMINLHKVDSETFIFHSKCSISSGTKMVTSLIMTIFPFGKTRVRQ